MVVAHQTVAFLPRTEITGIYGRSSLRPLILTRPVQHEERFYRQMAKSGHNAQNPCGGIPTEIEMLHQSSVALRGKGRFNERQQAVVSPRTAHLDEQVEANTERHKQNA